MPHAACGRLPEIWPLMGIDRGPACSRRLNQKAVNHAGAFVVRDPDGYHVTIKARAVRLRLAV